MSKALVIRGADFSVNKVDTVVLSDAVRCEGIELPAASVTMNKVGSVRTIVPALTPADTTDSVFWSSSDENVAVVVNGAVKQTGLGTAVITAVCGGVSASCAVNALTHVYRESDLCRCDRGAIIEGGLGGRVYYEANPAWAAFAMESSATGGYKAITNENVLGKTVYPIPLPKGANHISMDLPAGNLARVYFFYMDSGTCQTAEAGKVSAKVTGRTIRYLSGESCWSGGLTVPEGTDSFVFTYMGPAGSDSAAWTDPVAVTFSIAAP